MKITDWLMLHANATTFWQVVAFCAMVAMVGWFFRIQRSPDNGIDFFQLIYEPNTSRLAPERFAYVGAFIVTSVAVIFGITRPGITLDGIATLLVTYGSLWVVGSGIKKFADRPPAPLAPAAIAVPANQINVGTQPPNPNPQDGVQQ